MLKTNTPIERKPGTDTPPKPAGRLLCWWRKWFGSDVHVWMVEGEYFVNEWLAYQRAQYLTDIRKTSAQVPVFYFLNGHQMPANP